MSGEPSFDPDRLALALRLPIAALVVLVLFLVAVRLLGAATDAATPTLERVSRTIVVGDPSALGVGWLGAYGLANGSVVAALSLSLFAAGIVSTSQLFLLVAGSRLGGAAVVVLIGALDYIGERQYSLREGISMGLLTFLVTHSIYLPVTIVGYLSLPVLLGPGRTIASRLGFGGRPLGVFDPVTAAIIERLGALPAGLLAVVALFGALRLFDRVLERSNTDALRRQFFGHLTRPRVSFLIGLLVTGVTTSVAFSLGVVVPLYNRGYVEREEIIPYVLGANVGTLFDTLVVAIILDTNDGVAVVLALLLLSVGVTLVALIDPDGYSRAVSTLDDRLLADRRAFLGFLAMLLVVPLALLLVPLGAG